MIISILNQKGGVGKTTLAVNVARAFSKMGKRVLLVDADPQGSALCWHQAGNGAMLDMVCLFMPTIDKDIKKYVRMYDYIFIDGIPRVSPMTIYHIKLADIILIPVQPSPYDVWAAADIVSHIKNRQAMKDDLKAYFVISRKIINTRLEKEIGAELDKMELPVFRAYTSQRVDYPKSVEEGLTVIDGRYEGTPASIEILQIASELAGIAETLEKDLEDY